MGVRTQLTHPKLLPFVVQLPPCRLGMEACQSTHYKAPGLFTSNLPGAAHGKLGQLVCVIADSLVGCTVLSLFEEN